MEILILQYDPAQVPQTAMQQLVGQLMNAKNGSIVLAPTNVKFEVLDFMASDAANVYFGVTKNGSQVKILYDPQEEQMRIQKQQDAKNEYGDKH